MAAFKKRAIFRVTAFYENPLSLFFETLASFCKKTRIFLRFKVRKESQKKYTILRSPHVNKKARDQVKVKKIVYTFFTKGGKQNWLYFLLTLKSRSSSVLHFDYKHIHNQNLVLFDKTPFSENGFRSNKARFRKYIESLNEL